jgi:hypothetical protein
MYYIEGEVVSGGENNVVSIGSATSSGTPPINDGNKGTLGYRILDQDCNPNTIRPN